MGKPEKQTNILIVDDDKGHLATLKTVIKSWGYLPELAQDGTEAVERVHEKPYDLILMDVRMAVVSGIDALKSIKSYNPSIPVLIMTAYSSVDTAVEAMKAGAFDYLTKPLDFDGLKITIERTLEHKNLIKENKRLKDKLSSGFDLKNIIGKSRPMKEFVETVAMVAVSEATVLITGESGTGKELIARAIHANSDRKEGPLVVVNCAALTETLLESELFGHERGAFTGAEKRREGRFMQANRGTIFLDEIGEMPLSMQPKLLRIIQDREIQRVGSDEILKVDVRILAATNRDLQEDVESKKFREDLYYRLNVITLRVPPLRERLDDIPVLAQHFLGSFAKKNRKNLKGFTPLVMDMLLKYNWPGNVRELENAVERAVILSMGDYINEKELPLAVLESHPDGTVNTAQPSTGSEVRSLEELEKEAILSALEATNGNKSETARKLGINRRTLYKKIEKYGLQEVDDK